MRLKPTQARQLLTARASWSALLLYGALAGCGSDSDASPEMGTAAQNPASTLPAPAMPAPPAMQPAGEPPAPSAPSATPGNEMPPSMVPLQPGMPMTGGSDGSGSNGSGSGGSGSAPQAPPAMEPPAMEPPAMEPPAMEPAPPEEPAEFAPCPTDGSPCVIMPLGDSITFGLGAMTPVANQGGYRVELFRRALADAHEITFAGRVANGPNTVDGQPFPRGHEGYSGSTINDGGNQLANRVDAAIAAANPHIILLMIGTNDVFGQQNNPPSDLGNLLDQITTAAPDALLVVAQIVPTQQAAANTRVQAYNATMPGLVQERVAAGRHLSLVDMFTPFVSNPGGGNALLADVVHPNDAGYAIMAQTWYAAIEPFLP